MNVFGVGLPEMALIFAVALLVFGPQKLPEIGRSMGKAMRSLQDASQSFQDQFRQESQQLQESVRMTAELESDREPQSSGEAQDPPASGSTATSGTARGD